MGALEGLLRRFRGIGCGVYDREAGEACLLSQNLDVAVEELAVEDDTAEVVLVEHDQPQRPLITALQAELTEGDDIRPLSHKQRRLKNRSSKHR